jgi:hypothetical protein
MSAIAPTLFAADRVANPTYWTQTGASAAAYATAAANSAAEAAASAGLQGPNVGRNLFHNSMFRVQQRGVGPWTVGGYTADRWRIALGTAGGARSITLNVISDAERLSIGDEDAQFALRYAATGGSAAGDIDAIAQRIENVRRTANKSITVSFLAWATAGTPKVGVNAFQNFGSGGSPSPLAVALATGIPITIDTTPKQYQAVLSIPSVQGKTFGTTPNTDYLDVYCYLSSGATNNANAGNIGVQTCTVNFWGMQCEPGSSRTPLEKPDPQQDLAKCQRFYWASPIWVVASAVGPATYTYPTAMRANPTIAGGGAGFANSTTTSVAAAFSQTTAAQQSLTFSADL